MRIDTLLLMSKEIIDQAIVNFKPKAIVMMLSGGDDSTTAYYVSKELGISFDAVIHGNTRTGIPDTSMFAQKQAETFKDKFLVADAGNSYVDYVMRKGFFGVGEKAHDFSYHVLKIGHFRRVVSHNLRQRKRNFPILFINGARRSESKRRETTMINPYKLDPSQPNNIWVNIINDWDKQDCLDYMSGNNITRNPVSINLCRSGECMCGTMQTKGDRIEASYFYPEWGKWIDELEKEVIKKFPWQWGENISQQRKLEMKGQLNMFQPMCTGCKIQNE
jgi:3'-phosphoadenosine 5'-phosphosulfate sulfotransferase (PAPS reductase)/FAD synthetase